MMQIPPFHPEWLVTFWFSTPVLKWLNPHWFLLLLAGVVAALIAIRRKKQAAAPIKDADEEKFQHLVLKKQIIEKKISELETQKQKGKLTEESYEQKLREYRKHLDKVKLDLLNYT
jgi:uncharacterized membrane protein (DUF106 family)